MELKGWSSAKRRARELRREMSPAEVRLWLELRKNPGGYRFRRQHPAGPYDVDFYCAPAKLCIEVDGEAHSFGERARQDEARDSWLSEQGVLTMRVPAAEVMANLEGVVIHILETVRTRG